MKDKKTAIQELGDMLCTYCPWMKNGNFHPVSAHGNCEGRFCEEAYDNYLEESEEDDNEVKG